MNNLITWKTDLATQMLATSGRRDNMAVAWVKKAETEHVGWDALGDVPYDLVTLDRKLAAALMRLAKGEFADSLSHLAQTSMAAQGVPLTGVQILRRIYLSLRTTSSMNTYHSFRELGQLKWLGDHKIDRFKNHLNHILADVGQQMSDRAKCDFLLPIWDDSELLSDEARHWRRLPASAPEKNFQ